MEIVVRTIDYIKAPTKSVKYFENVFDKNYFDLPNRSDTRSFDQLNKSALS